MLYLLLLIFVPILSTHFQLHLFVLLIDELLLLENSVLLHYPLFLQSENFVKRIVYCTLLLNVNCKPIGQLAGTQKKRRSCSENLIVMYDYRRNFFKKNSLLKSCIFSIIAKYFTFINFNNG